jgi:adenylosuccinate lyase
MAAVSRGADRQEAHEVIRRHSREAQARRHRGEPPALLESLAEDAMFTGLTEAPDPSAFIGRSVEQVDRVLDTLVRPIRDRYAGRLDEAPELRV